ncbi:hypothetical protein ACIQ6K_33385 [Streptomyces sp. NPDC096354]|uniref:hypothetical protein n=1 Tax=Streptomyces sp. NPDC096354 TaxID=3366088 RepID=UPI003805F2D4
MARGVVPYAPGTCASRSDNPKVINPTEAITRTAATCVCGSELWDHRGINPVDRPAPFLRP